MTLEQLRELKNVFDGAGRKVTIATELAETMDGPYKEALQDLLVAYHKYMEVAREHHIALATQRVAERARKEAEVEFDVFMTDGVRPDPPPTNGDSCKPCGCGDDGDCCHGKAAAPPEAVDEAEGQGRR